MIRAALVRVDGKKAAVMSEDRDYGTYRIKYLSDYTGKPISLALPIREEDYEFDSFPPFFDGVLPEGYQLDALLRRTKLDRADFFGQLLEIGADLVGNVTVEKQDEEKE